MNILLYQIFFLLFQKLRNRYLFLLSCFAFLILFSPLLFSDSHTVQNQTGIPEYTCQVNYKCLNYLNNVLLNKESNKGIYKYCETNLNNIKFCCTDPSQCQEPWGKDFAKNLRGSSLKRVQNSGGDLLSCQLNQLSGLISSLSNIQNKACNVGLRNCNVYCEKKLKEVTQTFRQCFSISNFHSIKKALEKMQSHPIVERACFQKMYEVVEKYKKQSLDENILFREKLEAKDIVNCEEIKSVKNKSSVNNFALNMCHQAQKQKQEMEEKEKARKEREAELKKQAEEKARLEQERKVREEAIRRGIEQTKQEQAGKVKIEEPRRKKQIQARKEKEAEQKKQQEIKQQKEQVKANQKKQKNQALHSKDSSKKENLSSLGKKATGGFHRSLNIIGFSFPRHDQYLMQILSEIAIKFQKYNQFNELSIAKKYKKQKLKIIDFQENERDTTKFQKKLRFIDWEDSIFLKDGFNKNAISEIFSS